MLMHSFKLSECGLNSNLYLNSNMFVCFRNRKGEIERKQPNTLKPTQTGPNPSPTLFPHRPSFPPPLLAQRTPRPSSLLSPGPLALAHAACASLAHPASSARARATPSLTWPSKRHAPTPRRPLLSLVNPLTYCVDSRRPILTSYLRLAAKVALVSIFSNLKAPREPLR